ncbi:MAG: enoyl-CoA hydratase [Acidobacteria bacterium]|nr:MAG: enoyl-CoA hydratase [Acidobacteriota bacterium]REK01091.1 MAG: enoyl-CoA hydratase [Acidobacteriota bacterium]
MSDSAAYETIRTERDEDGVLLVTLDRPEKLNAFTGRMMEELIEVLREANLDDETRVLIVTGAGRGFCAGADLSSGGGTFERGETSIDEHRDGGGLLSLEIFRSLKPIIAAINGPAVGVGVTMTLPMDVRIASSAAKMGFVFARRGIAPEACSTFFLPRVVGISRASEWVMTGRVFPASEALEAGLVSRMVEPEALLPTAYELAREIARNTAPVSVALARQLLWRQLSGSSPMQAHRVESKSLWSRGRSADAKEGVESFLEKRPASFPNRVSDQMPEFFPWWEDEAF